MENLIPPIRNAPRAVILRQGNILLLRKEGGGRETRYALPGGAQDPGETLTDALQRECREEIGSEVRILGLLRVADFFKLRNTDPPSTRHLIEFLFRCEIADDYVPHSGHHPDNHQVAVEWLPLADLQQRAVFPPGMAAILQGFELANQEQADQPTYLGTLHSGRP